MLNDDFFSKQDMVFFCLGKDITYIANEFLLCKGEIIIYSNLESYQLSVIRQKGESENGCFKRTKHFKFSEKQTFLTP